MTFQGPLTNINAALKGPTFTPTVDYTGGAQFQVENNDLGATGPGGALTDSDTISIAFSQYLTDIAVAKTADNHAPIVDTDVLYTITAADNGPLDATELDITDLLPSGLTYRSSDASQGIYAPGSGLWNVGGLDRGGCCQPVHHGPS